MAARSWQDDLAQQAEEGSARLRELLSVGLGFLRTELGLDLGLEPKRYPGWVILMGTGALGLLLLFLLGYGWAAACAGARKKRRSPPRKREEAAPPTSFPEDPAQLKNLRSEEQKKKNRKKLPEKPKPNGRTVEVPEDEVVRTPRSITAKQPPETKRQNIARGQYRQMGRNQEGCFHTDSKWALSELQVPSSHGQSSEEKGSGRVGR